MVHQVEEVRKEVKDFYENCFKESIIKIHILEGVYFHQITMEERLLPEAPFSVEQVK